MPKLPTYIAQQGIKTGPVADQINAGAMTAPAAALGTFANASQDVGAFFQNREKEKGLRWTGDANYKFTNAMTEWHMANQDREDYGPAFKEHAEKVANDFVSAAPSKQAGDVLRHQLQGSISRQYEMALKVGEKTRFDNFELGEQNSTASSIEMFRQLGSIDRAGASTTIDGQHMAQQARITEAFGTKAPAFAAKLRRDATASVIQGVMDTDPDLAEMLLMESKDIPEQYRQIQLDKIDQTRKQLRVLDARSFEAANNNALANAEENGTYAIKQPQASFLATYPNEASAMAAYDKHAKDVDVHNYALDMVKDAKGMNESSMRAVLEASKSKVDGVVGQEARIKAGQMIDRLAKISDSHPVEYLSAYHPVVSKARELFEGATDKDRPRLFRQMNAEIMRYQGPAPEGAPDAGYYLGLDSHQVSLLPKDKAIEIAGNINNGTPDEKLKAIRAFEDTYANDPEARAIALRDLTQLPAGKALTQQVQALAMNYKEPYARQLAQSMAPGVAQNNAKAKGYELGDYNKEVKGIAWDAFASMYKGDNTQRANVVAGFRDAIVSYAASLDISDPANAVKQSIETLISSKFRFEDIGNQRVPFAKWAGPDGQPHSEEKGGWGYGDSEMDAVVKRVKDGFEQSIRSSDLMDTTDDGRKLWPLAPYPAGPIAVATYIDVDIEKNKVLVPSEDGKGMYVYLQTQFKIPIQLRTKDKRPLYISFDSTSKRHNLPVYASHGGRRIEELQAPPPEGFQNPFFEKYGPLIP